MYIHTLASNYLLHSSSRMSDAFQTPHGRMRLLIPTPPNLVSPNLGGSGPPEGGSEPMAGWCLDLSCGHSFCMIDAPGAHETPPILDSTWDILFLKAWRMIALQCCVNFCYMTTWISYKYAYIISFLDLPPTRLGHHRAPSWAPVLYTSFPVAIYFTHGIHICQCFSLNSSHPLLLSLCPQVHSLHETHSCSPVSLITFWHFQKTTPLISHTPYLCLCFWKLNPRHTLSHYPIYLLYAGVQSMCIQLCPTLRPHGL